MRAKISKTQQEVLDKMEIGVWTCAYDLQCKRSTLEALVSRRVARKRVELGAMFSPRVSIEYMKVKES